MKLLPFQGILREAVAKVDVLVAFALNHGVGLANGVGFFIEFLPIDFDEGIFVEFRRFLDSGGQHPARACGRIVQLGHKGRFADFLHVRVEENRHHEPDNLARREMLPGGFVGHLRETVYQVLENISHLIVAHNLRREVNLVHKFLDHQIQEIRLVQTVNLREYVKRLQYGAGVVGKALDIVDEIVPYQHGVVGEGRKSELADIVEFMPADSLKERCLVFVAYFFILLHHSIMGIFQNAIQAAQHREWQNDIAVFALLVVATQEVGNFPYKIGSLSIHQCQFLSRASAGSVRRT